MRISIICVDDEPIVLKGLKSQLKQRFGREYSFETVDSGEEALELYHDLLNEDICVPLVISDQIMPGMKGDELLSKLYELDPEIKSILLTGQASPEAVGSAVNNANLFRYIAKPWMPDDLNMSVYEAVNSYLQLKELQRTEKERVQLVLDLKQANESLEMKVEERTQELNNEKTKTEQLLLNTLPKEIMQELIASGSVQPRHFEKVSVLFTDFTSFTSISEEISPTELVETLNECFSAFDEIILKNNLEKIKTIGDAYMCAGGVPEVNTTNSLDTAQAAIEIIEWLENWNIQRSKMGKQRWNIRIGIHTGELVAGIIGKHKFAYDVWGDAVNIASRLESSGEAGKVNISRSTYLDIKDSFNCFPRGKINVKGKGDVEMFFIEN